MQKFTRNFVNFFSTQAHNKIAELLDIKNDKYNAIHITPKHQIENKLFDEYMKNLIESNLNNGTTSIWVHLNGEHISLISNLINEHSFNFHRGADKSVSLYRWILKTRKDMVVPYSLFHVGCGGVLIKDNSILLI